MLEAYQIDSGQIENHHSGVPNLEVHLTYEERKKSRHKTRTVCGRELGWFLDRGHVLADGEYLTCVDGTKVKIVAAMETVSEVVADDVLALTRAAYHLGNRHVPLQIGKQKQMGKHFLRYQHDHVLDDMVRGLGLQVTCESQPFHPESGAYHNHAHHSHNH